MLIVVAASTKRAQVPFSAWLPLAMAAPTPVSALVHSSTLVTAGVYILIRLNLRNPLLLKIILFLGVTTILVAGASGMMENDLKKVIALSTLSQLGVIICRLGTGHPQLAFFHLLTHAYFKAITFLSVGGILHISGRNQDLRKIGVESGGHPLVLGIYIIPRLRLGALPFISGFISKHMILDICLDQGEFGKFAFIFILIGRILTIGYSIRSYVLIVSSFKSNIWNFEEDNRGRLSLSAVLLWPFRVMGGGVLRWPIINRVSLAPLPLEVRNLVYVFMALGGTLGPLFLYLGATRNSHLTFRWGAIIGLRKASYPGWVATKNWASARVVRRGEIL